MSEQAIAAELGERPDGRRFGPWDDRVEFGVDEEGSGSPTDPESCCWTSGAEERIST